MTTEIRNKEENLIIYAKRFFSGTFLSRISGMGRDLMMAYAFGDHPSIAAFMVAFRFSNLFRRLLGEGPLQSAFIPYFEGLRFQDNAKAILFFRKLVLFITVVLFSLILFMEIGLASFVSFWTLSEGNREILILTSLLLPGLLFICLYGFNVSLLNCYDSFFIPSFAPFIFNIIWITAAFFLQNHDPSLAANSLAKWVVLAYLAQWAFTFPLTLRYASASWKDLFPITISSEIKTLAKSFGLGAIGVGAMQINSFADAIFARYADIRGPIYLWYSIRLEQLVLAIFGIACVSTITPSLSRAIKSSHLDLARNLFFLSYKRIITIIVPCTFAILVLGLTGVNLIYGYGNFSQEAVCKTTYCLFAYGLGLLPTVLIMLFSAIYYAEGNFRTPVLVSILSVIINLILNSFFVFVLKLGAISTAIGTSFSAWVNCLVLSYLVDKMGWKIPFSPTRLFGIVFASFFAASLTTLSDNLIFNINTLLFISSQNYDLDFFTKTACFLTEVTVFILGFLTYAFLFKNKDILDLFKELTNSSKSSSVTK